MALEQAEWLKREVSPLALRASREQAEWFLRDIVVLEPACATYDLPLEAATALGLPATAAHPKAETHHMGLYFMASRGAIIADTVTGI